MTGEDREWLERHIKGPILTRMDRTDEHIGNLRERIAALETRAVLAGGAAALVVSPIVAAIIVKMLQ